MTARSPVPSLPPSPAPGAAIAPRTHQIILEDLCVEADIGFHQFEVGHPQRLLIGVRVTLDLALWPVRDQRDASWDYDRIRSGIRALVAQQHFDLQETLARRIFDMIAAEPGVTALTVHLRKPDVYADAAAVGVLLSSE